MTLTRGDPSGAPSAQTRGRAVPPTARRAPATRPAARDGAPSREPGPDAADLVYVYAVLPAEDVTVARLDREPIRGLGQTPVRLLVEGPLAAVIGHVPDAEFGDAPLNGQVPDVRWLTPRAVAHHTVNAQLLERGVTLLPLAFGRAIFRTEEGVRQLLQRERAALQSRLARVRGRAEWVLTVRRDQAALAYVEHASPEMRRAREWEEARAAAGRPGRAYLRERRLERARLEALRRLDGEAAAQVLAALQPTMERAFPEPLLEGLPSEVILRASLLVPRAQEAAFLEALGRAREAWQERGYVVTVSGPWPAYRFGSLADQDARARAAHQPRSAGIGVSI